MNVHYRLKRSEVECRELHALHCGGAERGPQAQVAAILADRVSKLDRPGAAGSRLLSVVELTFKTDS
jgi:hypothetical protein